jgi:ubiquinone/menaquinone biosynthesis C-methylase UbiE
MGKPKKTDWDELADWYDKKQGDLGDLWHRSLIDPTLLRVVGNCRGLEVMDLGCGNGYLSRRLARGGARVIAVDASPRMIRNAKAHDPGDSLGISYLCESASRLEGIPSSRFDVVFANMSLMDIDDAKGAVKEAGRALKRGGRFVASISHPCFDVDSHSGWTAEKVLGRPPVVYRKVTGYRKLFSEEVPWKVGYRRMYTKAFHRPLNWYARAIRSAGMAITALEEPEPAVEFVEEEMKEPGDLDAAGFLEVPLHLVIEAIKL